MKLIWAYETRHPDTGQYMPSDDQISVSDRGYGPVQGSRLVRLNQNVPAFGRRNEVICVSTSDLWRETTDGWEHVL